MKKLGHKAMKMSLLAAVIVTSLANPVYAAESEDDAAVRTRDVVVSATRTEQEVKETPMAVEVITREDIDRMGAETLAQALKLAVGIDTMENGMVGNSVSIRGAGTNRTLMLIDGRRIRTEDTASTANNYELQRVNMDNVERIEIVRGPASSLYGSEALGGVINIILKKPNEPQTIVNFDATSKQTDQSIYADFGKQGKWAWSMSGRHTDVKRKGESTSMYSSRGAYIGESVSTNQYGDKYYWSLNGRMDIDENKHLDVFYDYMKEDMEDNNSYASGTVTSYKYVDAGTTYDHVRKSTGISYAGKDSRGDYELRTYYTKLNKNQRSRTSADNKLYQFDDMYFTSWITDGKRSLQLGDNHLLTFGGEYREEDYESSRLGNGLAQSDYELEGITNHMAEASIKYTALYVQDEWLVNDKTLLIPSIRYDHSDKFGDEVTAKLGSTYKISDNSRLKASVGSAYRAPTASELYMRWDHTPTGFTHVHITGNPDLKPEKSLNYELSFEAEKNDTSGKLTYFRNEIDDMISTSTVNESDAAPGRPPTRVDAYSNYVNVDEAEIQGLELEAAHKLNDKFSLKATHTYLDAKDKKNDTRLEGRAKNKTTIQLQYDDSINSGVTATLWNEWLHDYYSGTDSTTKSAIIDSVSTLNFVINKKFSDKYSMYFGVDNITDKENDNLGLDGRIWRTGLKLTI